MHNNYFQFSKNEIILVSLCNFSWCSKKLVLSGAAVGMDENEGGGGEDGERVWAKGREDNRGASDAYE